jgi:DNA-binding MarR family transcriptional regulator
VNISSRGRTNFHTTPEFNRLFKAIYNLKREVKSFSEGTDQVYDPILKSIDAVEHALRRHSRELITVEKALEMAASIKLTEKQRQLLVWLSESYNDEAVYTVLISRLAQELGIPKSTIRWNLKGLREAELIRAGDKDNKGIPVSLTPTGQIYANFLMTEGS